MADYIGISDVELAPGQPVTTSLMYRLRDDAISVAQNHPDVPPINAGNFVPRKIYISAPGADSFVVPDGVNRLHLTLQGGGGGGESAASGNGTSGGDTTITVGATTYTAEGGGGGGLGLPAAGTTNIPFFNGLSINGAAGGARVSENSGGSSQFSAGGKSRGGNAPGHGGGGGGGYDANTGEFDGDTEFGEGGGSGATAYVANVEVTPGQTVNVVVGAGGAGGTAGTDDGGSGSSGLIIIEY